MRFKKDNLILKFLTIGVFGFVCLGFNVPKNRNIIDSNKLASQYFNEDAQWYIENIPFFECSDKKIQEVYYYRWKLYKAHIRNVGESRYVITEFLDNVTWDKDPYSSLNDATGFHIYEGRWLKNSKFINGYIDYMFRGGGNDLHFSEAITYASFANYLVNADSAFITNQLGIMQHIYNLWLDHYDLNKNLYYIEPLADATEYTISSIDASGGMDGFTGGDSFRPTINSYMYGNALAISQIAIMKGDTTLSRLYLNRAADIKANVQHSLWNDSLQHFIDRYKVNNKFVHYWDFIRGRELAGFVPWCYNLPENTSKYSAAWSHLMDSTELLGKYGLRTVEPTYQYYMKQYRYEGVHPECQWNGPNWPFQTTQAFVGMANLLNNYSQNIVKTSDYLKILRLYTKQHYTANGQLDLQEDYNPDTGKPIVGLSRSHHYNHSGYNDLIITGLCGIRPSEGNTLIINPLVDNSIQYFCLEDIIYHGHKMTVVYDKDGSKYKLGKGLTVFIDGEKAFVKKDNNKYEVEIGKPIINKSKPSINFALNIFRKGYPAPSASVNSIPDSLYQAIDGRCWYFQEIKNRWTTYGSTSINDWYAVDFGCIRSVSTVKIYIYADNVTYKKPDNYNIEYWSGGKWLPVNNVIKTPSLTIENTVNTVSFDKIATTQLRINLKQEAQKSVIALSEIEMY
ncbi:MAG: trehalase family glycosidase [Paludibacter sp.]|nr:trehalase family glycosidase [Paludibacter sp.]